MLFSSITFLYYFLPAVLIIYFLTPKKGKNLVLLISSFIFYGWGEPVYILFMALSIIVQYILGLLIEKHQDKSLAKFWLVLSICFSIGLLGYFKYTDFFIANFNAATGLSVSLLKIALPVGISFYTFQILSYTIDVYRKNARAQRNIIDLATYIALFPQLIAGPIVRYVDVDKELKNRTHSVENFKNGLFRFIIGLAKKVLIANSLGELCSIFNKSPENSVLFYWMYAISFTLQIYFDFSGYSDMAIGLGKILGFNFLENFNYPFISKSITDFWRRWHMSLGSWFRDYLYIPLGGNRVSKARWLLNIFIVWMLTGFWHGADWNFILWGLLFAVMLIIEKLWLEKFLKKIPAFFSHIYVLLIVVLSFVIFDASSLNEAMEHIGSMFGFNNHALIDVLSVYYLKSYALIFVLAIVGSTPLIKRFVENLKLRDSVKKVILILEPIVAIILLIFVTAYLVDSSFNPFLYFRF